MTTNGILRVSCCEEGEMQPPTNNRLNRIGCGQLKENKLSHPFLLKVSIGLLLLLMMLPMVFNFVIFWCNKRNIKLSTKSLAAAKGTLLKGTNGVVVVLMFVKKYANKFCFYYTATAATTKAITSRIIVLTR